MSKDFTAWCLDGKGNGTLLPLSRTEECRGPVWTHLRCDRPEVQEWIHSLTAAEPIIAETLLAETTRPRALVIDQGLLLTLRAVNLNPGADPDDMVSLRLWITANQIISTHLRPLKASGELEVDIEHAHGPRDSGEFLAAILDKIINNMAHIIDDIEERTDQIETQVLSERIRPVSDSDMTALRAEIITLRRYIGPQRVALDQILTEHLPWLKRNAGMRIRESINRLTRYTEALDSARDRTRIMQEQSISRLTEQLGRRLYFITLLSAVFLPLTFLTGLLGVNLAGIPGAQDHAAFLWFAGGLGLIAVIEIVLFRRLRWL